MKFLAELMTYTFMIFGFGIGSIIGIKKMFLNFKEKNIKLKNKKNIC